MRAMKRFTITAGIEIEPHWSGREFGYNDSCNLNRVRHYSHLRANTFLTILQNGSDYI